MGINDSSQPFDQQFDVVVVGTGAGGLTAALCAKARGLTTVIIEKEPLWGGTTAVSGGGIWIPCNDQIESVGGHDSFADALTYLKHLIGDAVPQSKIETYLKNAPEMVRLMEREFDVRFRSIPKYPDYFPDAPGSRPGYRTMEPAHFDARQLGDEFDSMRDCYRGQKLMGRMSMDQVEGHTLFTRGPGWIWLTLRMMLRYFTDFAWRRKTPRDRRLTMGQALVASLRRAMKKHDVPLWLETSLESLVEADGRVTGIVAKRHGRTLRIGARHAVILASGGFESNQQMREEFLPKPTSTAWTAAPKINFGDGIRAGRALGAKLGFMDLTWGTPTMPSPTDSPQPGLFVERNLPGCIVVNQAGQRYVNEALPYTEFVYAMYREQAKNGNAVPSWMIFDARFRKNYPMGALLPGSIAPDASLPKDWLGRVYHRADSLDALAREIGVDAKGLAASVADINRFSASGKDEQFDKGGDIFQRYYSDPSIKPNPCLAPIVKAPYYAVRLDAGELGTKGGLVTDERSRVLREDGSPIPGLYATGNCSASVMGRTYAGPGATLGPAMTFGMLAAQDIAAAAAPVAKAA
ncbi:MAG TPA: FAD-dependent oxidoreductase [Nevskiaceae bacterium]|nr:FAD-dependent oxidoreductase [Nevskiaceae bacterium]